MMKLSMSRAASGLLRALLDRSGGNRDRILLSEIRSTDWQSLTFAGERHELTLKILGPGAAALADRMIDGIEEAEFRITGHIVADIAVTSRERESSSDDAITIAIEALTVAE